MLPGYCYPVLGRAGVSIPHRRETLPGWATSRLPAAKFNFKRPSASTSAATGISDHLMMRASQIQQDYSSGKGWVGGNCLLEDVGQPPSPRAYLPPPPPNKRTQQCRGLCQSPPPTLIKCFCIFLPRDSRCAPSRSPNIHC